MRVSQKHTDALLCEQEERGTVLKRVFLEYAVLHTRNSKVRTPPKKWRGSLIV